MLNKDIKVCWCVYKHPIKRLFPFVNDIIKYKFYKQGTIVDFTTNIFGITYAIIDTGDNKVIKLKLNKLTVLHNKKKK